MALILNVPFEEKDEAKALGARWDVKRKVWYVPNVEDFHKFEKWMGEGNVLVTDYFYIMISTKKCFRCHKDTLVIGFAFDKFYEFDEEKGRFFFVNEFTWMSSLKNSYHKEAEKYLLEKYNYKLNYSKFVNDSYYSVTCQHCGVIQGEHFLFDSDESSVAPFEGVDDEVSKKIILMKVKIPYCFPANIGWMGDCNILDCATIVECTDDTIGESFCRY